MLFHVDMIYLAKRDVKKKRCFEMRTVTKSNPERDFFSFMAKLKKNMQMFACSEQAHYKHGMYITALIPPSVVKNRTNLVL